MSRVIVKNLPAKISEDQLREEFGSKGHITDIQMKFSKDGIFRKFAFIGYKTEEEAEAAKNHFNNTYIRSSKVSVDICVALGDSKKPRSWSKYAKDSSVNQTKLNKEEKSSSKKEVKKDKKKKKREKLKEDEEFNKLKEDPQFAEFVEINKTRDAKSLCSNDTGALKAPNDEQNDSEVEEKPETESDEEPNSNDTEKPKQLTDLEYLKSKMITKIKKDVKLYTIVVRNLPCKCKKSELKKLFVPGKATNVRQPPKIKGIAYITFKTEKEMIQALHKNKSFFKGRKIEVTKFETKQKNSSEEVIGKKAKWEEAAKQLEGEESIAESGRLFIRNLPYTLTEEDLTSFFLGYGPLTESNLPIDKYTNKPKGFAFVTFVFPEHAAKAYSELDGKILQGRIVHILPSKPKPNEEDNNEHQNYKMAKKAKEKSQSGSSHNWNTLFLGADAVANAMEQRYKTSKRDILNAESSDSIAVRLALGETQLVNETRKFLERNGVRLESFEQLMSGVERSKTSILVKNLPVDATAEELNTLFSLHGSVKRVVLPPHGITAIVEFLAASHARDAFRKLAYTQFQHVPLYLEWAPAGTFKEENAHDNNEEEHEKDEGMIEEKVDDDDNEPEDDTTLYVKNLNFDTTDKDFKKHFSKCGHIYSASVSRRQDIKNPGILLSMGFGFVQYKRKADASKALEHLQHTKLDGHVIEIKRSNRTTKSSPKSGRKKSQATKQKSSKILVRNIPFEAKKSEVEKLFSTFGVLTSVRLPQNNLGYHRGFAFVEFASRQEAKRAFEALSASTHLYGRRLVLEWSLDDGNPEDDAQTLRRKADHHLPTTPKKKLKMTSILDELQTSSHHEKDRFS